MLEGANIKLSGTVSNINGKSARALSTRHRREGRDEAGSETEGFVRRNEDAAGCAADLSWN